MYLYVWLLFVLCLLARSHVEMNLSHVFSLLLTNGLMIYNVVGILIPLLQGNTAHSSNLNRCRQALVLRLLDNTSLNFEVMTIFYLSLSVIFVLYCFVRAAL